LLYPVSSNGCFMEEYQMNTYLLKYG